MKAKLLLTLALLAGSAPFAHAAVFAGAGVGVVYNGCYGCGYYPRARVVVGYVPGWRRPWYRGYYWRAGYWARPAHAGTYWVAPPPPPTPTCPTVAPAPALVCPPPAPAAAPKACVRKHHTVTHAKKATPPCSSASS